LARLHEARVVPVGGQACEADIQKRFKREGHFPVEKIGDCQEAAAGCAIRKAWRGEDFEADISRSRSTDYFGRLAPLPEIALEICSDRPVAGLREHFNDGSELARFGRHGRMPTLMSHNKLLTNAGTFGRAFRFT
jgi:hypothetical protein